jgi:hypothetical protein
MTESQEALYGGSIWLGPLFLAGSVLLYLWLSNGPFTGKGKRNAEKRRAYTGVLMAIRNEERRRGISPRDPSFYLPADVNRRWRLDPEEVDPLLEQAFRVMERPIDD